MENASKALIIAGAILISILLISIGIILVNSGRDVTSTGTAGMQSQKIQTFNAQFTPYEGVKKGAEIKSLISVVEANNATDSEHSVTIGSYQSQGHTVSNAGDIKDSANYDVSLIYASKTETLSNIGPMNQGYVIVGPRGGNVEKGYIYLINITPK